MARQFVATGTFSAPPTKVTPLPVKLDRGSATDVTTDLYATGMRLPGDYKPGIGNLRSRTD